VNARTSENLSTVLACVSAISSAISSLPGWLLQNEKNTGRYHLKIGNGAFATTRGVRRTALDRRIGTAIRQLLCDGSTDLDGIADTQCRARLAPFEQYRLIHWNGTHVTLDPDARPYARAIAAALDPYRANGGARFSNAV